MSLVPGYASESDSYSETEEKQSTAANIPAPSSFSSTFQRSGHSNLSGPDRDQHEEDDSEDDDEDAPTGDPLSDPFGLSRVITRSVPSPPRQSQPESSSGKGRRRKAHLNPSNALIHPAAPEVGDVSSKGTDQGAPKLGPADSEMLVNLPYDVLARSAQDHSTSEFMRKRQNVWTGHVEPTYIRPTDFRNEQRTFETKGFAHDPSLLRAPGGIVGDVKVATQDRGSMALDHNAGLDSSEMRAKSKALKKNREQTGDASVPEGEGAYKGPWAGWAGEQVQLQNGVGPSEEQLAAAKARQNLVNIEKEQEKKKQEKVLDKTGTQPGTEKSTFHGDSLYDYQGRTFMSIPTDVDTNLLSDPGEQTCFLPKECVHEFTGHTKGVSSVRLFPRSGHLLLSASMDTKVKLWDVYHDGRVLRTYMGHNKAVRTAEFDPTGTKFLTASYDRQVKLWDTETGQAIRTFGNGKTPNCVAFHPDLSRHTFLAGMADKKIIQYDLRSGEVTQEYDQHLGAVNSITFVDENRRFVTTSDDKTMRAWDFDIPVVIKYIADPTMYSMPSVTLSPSSKWLACQSLDNQILVYTADTFRINRKKSFKGHNVGGYACQPNFSPDGRFVSSGDGSGNIVFWDWKSTRILKRIKAHNKVVISHCWLPHETSQLITGSWDGSIKLWA